MSTRSSTLIDAMIDELNAAIDRVRIEIRGHADLLATTMSEAALAPIAQEKLDDERRESLLLDALAALLALKQDGYPDDPPVTVPADIFREMQNELAAIMAALQDFTAESAPAPAENVTINLGEPQLKP